MNKKLLVFIIVMLFASMSLAGCTGEEASDTTEDSGITKTTETTETNKTTDLNELADQTMKQWVNDLQKEDLSTTYLNSAATVKENYTSQKLTEYYSRYFPIKEEYLYILETEPVLNNIPKSEFDPQGNEIAVAQGSYSNSSYLTEFKIDFIKENGEWKIFNIMQNKTNLGNLGSLTPYGQVTAPNTDTLNKMLDDTMKIVFMDLKNGNLNNTYLNASNALKSSMTQENFTKVIMDVVNSFEADGFIVLDSEAGDREMLSEPTIIQGPSGIALMKTQIKYSNNPEVIFGLDYVHENGEWKLGSLGIYRSNN